MATRTRNPSDRMTKKELRKLEKLVVEYLTPMALFGVEKTTVLQNAGHRTTATYECVISTKCGNLRVTYSDWSLHCRFCEEGAIEAAFQAGVGSNKYSGKYNTYAFGRVTAEEAFGIFRRHIERVRAE